MADFQQTFGTSNGAVAIPSYAINVRVDLAGASGGQGGLDKGGTPGNGGAGRRAVIYFPNYTARVLSFGIGSQGGNAGGCQSNGPGGGGGASTCAYAGNGGNSADYGCSGPGGGGGGASGIYDSLKNGWVAVCGGGGGGGGVSLNRSATNGGTATGLLTGNPNNRTIGGQGQKNTTENGSNSSGPDGGGGGGGGGGCVGGGGGAYGVDSNRGGGGGSGGQSGYDSSYCSFNTNSGSQNFGNGFAIVYYDIIIPSVNSFTASPNPIIRGNCTTLSWTTSFGNLGGGSISGIGGVSFDSNGNGSTVVCPTTTTTYTLSLNNVGQGGTADTANRQVTVYQPPVMFISANPSGGIIAGNCTNISWYVTGDGDTIVWTAGGLTNTNVTSNQTVCPSDSITYSGYATGLGGTSPLVSVTVPVYQIPTLSVDWPGAIGYGLQAVIEYTAVYANTSVQLFATYSYYDAPDQSIGPINLAASGSPFLNASNASVTSTYNTAVDYDNRGAKSVVFTIVATGVAGNVSLSQTINILIDRTPDNINIPESEDLIRDEEPVITPETEILSEMLYVDDIDIDVEISSNYPISVKINDAAVWTEVREIGPGVGGNSIEQLLPVGVENDPGLELKNYYNSDDLVFDDPNLVENEGLEDPEEFIVKTSASASFNFSNGSSSITIIRGNSVSFTWNLSGGYTSASITNHGTLSAQGSAITYSVQNIPRWFSTSPAPGDHMCSPSNPGGYAQEGTLFKSFTTQAPGTFFGYDNESGVKPYAGIGYVYPRYSSGHPVSTSVIYEKIDPAGGPPNGFGTIWTRNSGGEGPYTANGPNTGFRAPNSGYTDYSNIYFSGSATKAPFNTTTYTISASGTSNYSKSITVTVLVPPTVVLSSSLGSIIIAGQTTNISWYVTGDADTLTWTTGNIPNTNLTSNANVTPGDTITYCARASGIAGNSPIACITITVLQPPTATLTVPVLIDYDNDNFSVGYDTQYATQSITLTATYTYLDGSTDTSNTINIATASSASLSSPAAATESNGTIDWSTIGVPWNNFGPSQISFSLSATGTNTGNVTQNEVVVVDIDQTPDNVVIPESDDLIRDQEPVITPDTVILTDKILINDIDIPVEINSDFPILVDKNANNVWLEVRNAADPAVAGNADIGSGDLVQSESFQLSGETLKSSAFYSDDPDEERPLIAEISNSQLAQLINCISIIDEVSPAVSTQQADWTAFRNNYQFRTFWLLQASLQPGGGSVYPISRLNMPSNYLNDPYANGGIQVRRDDGNTSFTSSWFDICGLASLPDGTYVSLWIDISGSMTFSTIQASYNEFVADCAANNVNIILETSDSGERWIPGHNKDLPPSLNFKIIDTNGNAVNSVTVLAGSAVTLAWIVFGDVNSITLAPNILDTTNSNFFYASTVVYPTEPTNYILTANGPAGNSSLTVQVFVLVPPEVFLSANPGTSIITGECVDISWYTTGDADTLTWTTGNISNTNLTSNVTVCPADTTTYCASATGIAGTSPVSCITITVSQYPVCSITSPAVINYGDTNFSIEYETQFANASITITASYVFLNGTTSAGPTIIIPAATSAQLGSPDSETRRDGVIDLSVYPVPWGNFGPSQINYTISVTGTGGLDSDSSSTQVIIDITPDSFQKLESDDKLIEQEPVYAPETDILSEKILINDIDIPVEIKSDYPIQVDINGNNTWEDIREI